MLKVFVLGVLVGWVAEWLIDWFWWRRRPVFGQPAPSIQPAVARVARVDGVDGVDGSPVPAGAVASAGTTAGSVAADVAAGAAGAVSTSSATMSTQAPVFRQCDLEAIPGLGPRTAAMLRHHGVSTFRQLADSPDDALARIVRASGDEPDAARIAGWRTLARRAAAGGWAGFAMPLPGGR